MQEGPVAKEGGAWNGGLVGVCRDGGCRDRGEQEEGVKRILQVRRCKVKMTLGEWEGA